MSNSIPVRRERLLRSLKERGQAALLITNPIHVLYLSKFRGEDASILITDERCILITDGRFVTQIENDCPDQEAHIKPIEQSATGAIAKVISELGVSTVAFEKGSMTVAVHETLRDAIPTVTFVGFEGLVEDLREIKDNGEIEAIRQAIGYAEAAFLKLRPRVKPDLSEREIAGILENQLREEGATGSSFPPIVAFGQRSALPHARPTNARLGESDFLLIDWGATGHPYKSDLTRVLVTGKVTPKFERIYRIVQEAQRRGISAIRPGATGNEVDAEARSVIEEAGFGSFFDHGLGHGIGLEIHEAPRIRRGSETILQPGMVVTIEPGIYLPDWGGIRLEDDILVTPDGYEVLSRLPTILDSVRLDAALEHDGLAMDRNHAQSS